MACDYRVTGKGLSASLAFPGSGLHPRGRSRAVSWVTLRLSVGERQLSTRRCGIRENSSQGCGQRPLMALYRVLESALLPQVRASAGSAARVEATRRPGQDALPVDRVGAQGGQQALCGLRQLRSPRCRGSRRSRGRRCGHPPGSRRKLRLLRGLHRHAPFPHGHGDRAVELPAALEVGALPLPRVGR